MPPLSKFISRKGNADAPEPIAAAHDRKLSDQSHTSSLEKTAKNAAKILNKFGGWFKRSRSMSDLPQDSVVNYPIDAFSIAAAVEYMDRQEFTQTPVLDGRNMVSRVSRFTSSLDVGRIEERENGPARYMMCYGRSQKYSELSQGILRAVECLQTSTTELQELSMQIHGNSAFVATGGSFSDFYLLLQDLVITLPVNGKASDVIAGLVNSTNFKNSWRAVIQQHKKYYDKIIAVRQLPETKKMSELAGNQFWKMIKFVYILRDTLRTCVQVLLPLDAGCTNVKLLLNQVLDWTETLASQYDVPNARPDPFEQILELEDSIKTKVISLTHPCILTLHNAIWPPGDTFPLTPSIICTAKVDQLNAARAVIESFTIMILSDTVLILKADDQRNIWNLAFRPIKVNHIKAIDFERDGKDTSILQLHVSKPDHMVLILDCKSELKKNELSENLALTAQKLLELTTGESIAQSAVVVPVRELKVQGPQALPIGNIYFNHNVTTYGSPDRLVKGSDVHKRIREAELKNKLADGMPAITGVVFEMEVEKIQCLMSKNEGWSDLPDAKIRVYRTDHGRATMDLLSTKSGRRFTNGWISPSRKFESPSKRRVTFTIDVDGKPRRFVATFGSPLGRDAFIAVCVAEQQRAILCAHKVCRSYLATASQPMDKAYQINPKFSIEGAGMFVKMGSAMSDLGLVSVNIWECPDGSERIVVESNDFNAVFYDNVVHQNAVVSRNDGTVTITEYVETKMSSVDFVLTMLKVDVAVAFMEAWKACQKSKPASFAKAPQLNQSDLRFKATNETTESPLLPAGDTNEASLMENLGHLSFKADPKPQFGSVGAFGGAGMKTSLKPVSFIIPPYVKPKTAAVVFNFEGGQLNAATRVSLRTGEVGDALTIPPKSAVKIQVPFVSNALIVVAEPPSLALVSKQALIDESKRAKATAPFIEVKQAPRMNIQSEVVMVEIVETRQVKIEILVPQKDVCEAATISDGKENENVTTKSMTGVQDEKILRDVPESCAPEEEFRHPHSTAKLGSEQTLVTEPTVSETQKAIRPLMPAKSQLWELDVVETYQKMDRQLPFASTNKAEEEEVGDFMAALKSEFKHLKRESFWRKLKRVPSAGKGIAQDEATRMSQEVREKVYGMGLKLKEERENVLFMQEVIKHLRGNLSANEMELDTLRCVKNA